MSNAPIIGGLFKAPAPPTPVQAPLVANPQDARTKQEMDEAADDQRKAKGSASDILTGGAGLPGGGALSTSSNILLGS